ncbi:MAG: dockerin type I repeat-containing protein [Oscillospiraceae bacterium]|nr:dockerin type I repeat-containing protein [Oscillospiraceae bacterium]
MDEVLVQPYAPEDLIYRIWAWFMCDDRIPEVYVTNTDYISIGLTEAEVYNKYTFEEFMTLSTEEICGITEELKEMYEETAPAARELGFNKRYNINFSAEYQNTVDVPYYTDLVAARKMIREELRIPEELYRGIITPTYSGNEYPTINLYISDKNLEEFTARYNCDEAEVAARLLVWLNLNPNVTSAGGGYTPEGVAGGVNPHYMYDDKGFENVLASDVKGIFHLPYDASLYYVDALEIAQELGFDDETDLCTYTYKVKINNWNGYCTDGVFTNYTELFETLYITEDWLRNGTISGPFADAESEKSIWFDINLDEDFYNSCLAQGYDNTDIMATIYMWLGYGAAQDISFEENPNYTEPAVHYGEINRDGQVSLLDVVTLSKYNAGVVTLNESQLKTADCTGDGIVNGSDATALQMFIVELITALPVKV